MIQLTCNRTDTRFTNYWVIQSIAVSLSKKWKLNSTWSVAMSKNRNKSNCAQKRFKRKRFHLPVRKHCQSRSKVCWHKDRFTYFIIACNPQQELSARSFSSTERSRVTTKPD